MEVFLWSFILYASSFFFLFSFLLVIKISSFTMAKAKHSLCLKKSVRLNGTHTVNFIHSAQKARTAWRRRKKKLREPLPFVNVINCHCYIHQQRGGIIFTREEKENILPSNFLRWKHLESRCKRVTEMRKRKRKRERGGKEINEN